MKISKYINKEQLNFRDIKQFIRGVVQEELIETNMENQIKFEFDYVNLNGYSSIISDKNLEKFKLLININRIKFNYIIHKDQKEFLFELYRIILKEIEYIKTLILTQKKDFYDYEHLLILMEYFNNLSINNIDVEKLLDKKQINLEKLILFGKNINKCYRFSTIDLKSKLVSYQKSIKMFEKYLTIEEKNKYKLIIDTLQRLNDKCETAYNYRQMPYIKFNKTILNMIKQIKKDKNIMKKFQILQNIFNADGNMLNCYELYKNINEQNKKMYDKMIIELFINTKFDYSRYFDDLEFKKHIEELASKYINDTIDYFEHFDEYEIFIKNKMYLKENMMLLKRNVTLLRENCKEYGMTLITGTLMSYKHIKKITKKEGI